MLRNIDPLLTPDLLKILREMGHGDEIAIVDANYPAASDARRLVYLPGADTSQALAAILTLMPLDTFVDCAAYGMAIVGEPDRVEPTHVDFQRIIDTTALEKVTLERIERFAFYERVRQAFAVVSTAERRLYGNILLKKGIIRPD
jgi:L-fucose mutarotase